MGDGALLVQEGKEALEDPKARRDRARGQRVTERGLEPGIHIRGGCGLTSIMGSGPILVIVERGISYAADVHLVGRSRACDKRQAATPV